MKKATNKKQLNNLRDSILKNDGNIKGMLVEQKLNKLFEQNKENREDRVGLHGSEVIKPDEEFCYRKAVLSFYFKGKEVRHPLNVQRIFLNGNYVHEKWQRLFKQTGVAVAIEQRGESIEWGLLFTPDAAIKLGNKYYVVEIKSVNTIQFKQMKSHPSGEKQLQLYMHMTGMPNGFVLCEDKNNQEIKVFPFEYDPMKAKPFVERMHKVKLLRDKFEKERKLPVKMCTSASCKKAQGCPYKNACFNIERIPLKNGQKTGELNQKAVVNNGNEK